MDIESIILMVISGMGLFIFISFIIRQFMSERRKIN